MVGVPRSKGCTLCVKRRVKCDQARPGRLFPLSLARSIQLRVQKTDCVQHAETVSSTGQNVQAMSKSASSSTANTPSSLGEGPEEHPSGATRPGSWTSWRRLRTRARRRLCRSPVSKPCQNGRRVSAPMVGSSSISRRQLYGRNAAGFLACSKNSAFHSYIT